MVSILREGVLSADSIVASVVVLPLPVGPVMMTPCSCGKSMKPPELTLVVGAQFRAWRYRRRPRSSAATDGTTADLAVLGRHDGDAEHPD